MIDPQAPNLPVGPRCQRCGAPKDKQHRHFRFCGRCTADMVRGGPLVLPVVVPPQPIGTRDNGGPANYVRTERGRHQ